MKTVFNRTPSPGWHRRTPGVPSGGMGYLRRWTRADVRRVAARSRPRLRFLVAAVAAVGMLAIAAHSDVLGPVSHGTQPVHAVASSLGGQFAIPVGHPHVDNG